MSEVNEIHKLEATKKWWLVRTHQFNESSHKHYVEKVLFWK